MSSSSLSSFVASGVSLCISFEMINNKQGVFKASTGLFQVQKINSTKFSNGAYDVIDRSGPLPFGCGFFCFTHGH